MKIVCEACKTEHEVDDQKVTGTGRVFRVSCPSCSGSMLVDGVAGQSMAPLWYLSLGGERQGPMSEADLRQHLRQMDEGVEPLIWSKGMDRWRPAGEIDGLAPPWQGETVQSDGEEIPDETTVISLADIQRLHADLAAMEAPTLDADPVPDLVPSEAPDLPPPLESVEVAPEPSASSSESEPPPPGEESTFDEASDDELGSTMVFEIEEEKGTPSPSLPEASEVLPALEVPEELDERTSGAASLFRLDDLELKGQPEEVQAVGQGVVGVTSTSLFVDEVSGPTLRDRAPTERGPYPAKADSMVTSVVTALPRSKAIPLTLGLLLAAGVVFALMPSAPPQQEAAPDSPVPTPSEPQAQGDRPEAPRAEVAAAKPPGGAAPASLASPMEERVKGAASAPPASGALVPTEVSAPLAEGAAAVEKTKSAPEDAAGRGGESTPKAATPSRKKKRAKKTPKSKSASQSSTVKASQRTRSRRAEPKPDFGGVSRSRATKKAKKAKKSHVKALLGDLKKEEAKGDRTGASDGRGDTAIELPKKLSASAVRGTLRKRQARFKACYRKMVDRPAGAVTVKTSFVIGSEGRVKSARIISALGVDPAVQSCIVGVVRGARFPKFRDPQMVVNYPILLR